jgi:hypothetical protein
VVTQSEEVELMRAVVLQIGVTPDGFVDSSLERER